MPSIMQWLREAQRNIDDSNPDKVSTAIFVDVCNDMCNIVDTCDNMYGILNGDSMELLGSSENSVYYKKEMLGRESAFIKLETDVIERMKMLAKQGDVRAQLYLGNAFANGDGVEKNLLEAELYFYRAAHRGNDEALFALVDLHSSPGFTGNDSARTMYYYEKAAEKGYAKAKALLEAEP
jgi:TPR repeat protein